MKPGVGFFFATLAIGIVIGFMFRGEWCRSYSPKPAPPGLCKFE